MAEAVAKENTAGLDAQLDTYSAQLVSDNQRLKAELRVHSEVSTCFAALLACIFRSLAHREYQSGVRCDRRVPAWRLT